MAPIQEKEEIEELAKIEAIEIEFIQYVLPWLKLVPKGSSQIFKDKVLNKVKKIFLSVNFEVSREIGLKKYSLNSL